MSVDVQQVQAAVDVLAETRHEHQGAHLGGCGGGVLLLIELIGKGGEQPAFFGRDLLIERLDFGGSAGFFQRLAPVHLLHQESRGHGRVAFGIHRHTTQFTQVGGTAQRVFQALVGLVDPHGPLHGDALSGRAFRGKAVGVNLGLQIATARIQLGPVQPVLLGQPEEREVIVRKFHKTLL